MFDTDFVRYTVRKMLLEMLVAAEELQVAVSALVGSASILLLESLQWCSVFVAV